VVVPLSFPDNAYQSVSAAPQEGDKLGGFGDTLVPVAVPEATGVALSHPDIATALLTDCSDEGVVMFIVPVSSPTAVLAKHASLAAVPDTTLNTVENPDGGVMVVFPSKLMNINSRQSVVIVSGNVTTCVVVLLVWEPVVVDNTCGNAMYKE